MATADFWTSALPVIGTIGGGVLVAITTALATGRRDRRDRAEKYRAERRTTFVSFMQEFSKWRRASVIIENLVRDTSKPPSSSDIETFHLMEMDVEHKIIELRVLVRKYGSYHILSQLPDELEDYGKLVDGIASYENFSEVARDQFIEHWQKGRDDIFSGAMLI